MALSLAAFLPGFAILAITQYQVNRSRHMEMEQLAVRSAKQAAFELDRIIASVKILIVTVSHVPDVRALNDAGCNAYLAALRPELPYLTGLTVIDSAGRFRCGFTPSPSAEESFLERPYFQDAIRAHDPVIGDYTAGRASGRPVLPVAMALRDASDQPDGVIVAALDLSWLGEMLRARGLPPGGSLTVADRTGVIIARQPLSDRFVGTRIPNPYLRLLTAPQAGWEEVMSQDGTRRILGYVPLSEPPVGLYVSAGLSTAVSYEAVNMAAWVGAALAITGVFATLLATWSVGSRVFIRPIEYITGTLRRWRAGDHAARTGYRAFKGEIGELGAELDRLMDEIGRSQEQRELLAGELEHRVKNTLATVHALAVSTMNRAVSGKELLPEFLGRIDALARTHEVLTRERWDTAELRQLLRGVFRPLVGDDLGRRLHMTGPDVLLPPGEALGLTMVMHELCTNALKYGSLGAVGGSVELTWVVGTRSDERWLEMIWREKDGPFVPPPDGRAGFGTRMIGRALGGFGRAQLEFEPSGLICRIEIALPEAADTREPAPSPP